MEFVLSMKTQISASQVSASRFIDEMRLRAGINLTQSIYPDMNSTTNYGRIDEFWLVNHILITTGLKHELEMIRKNVNQI